MYFKLKFILVILFFICNNVIAQDSIAWNRLDSVFTKIINTEDFRLTKKQKEKMISNSNYKLEMVDTFFRIENWEYEFDDFFQTDNLIFNVKMFEDLLKNENGGNKNYGVNQLEKIIDQILGKDYVKFKDAEVIERENRRDDNVIELIEDFKISKSRLIQWMHISDAKSEDFIPLQKSVRIFYDGWFDEIIITFNGVDKKMK
ncbi:MAG: hypothetical protein AB8F94_03570 [Saprospiraceae bacterium]